MRRVVAALAAVAAALAVPAAQSDSPPPGYRVQIDAFTTDARGRTVDALTVADFDIREDGMLQTLDSVRCVRDEARNFAVFLDEYHVSPVNTDRVRAALTRFVDSQLPDR